MLKYRVALVEVFRTRGDASEKSLLVGVYYFTKSVLEKKKSGDDLAASKLLLTHVIESKKEVFTT